jgi:hypothetical protein
MTDLSDDRLEAALRDLMAASRPGVAPPELRARVDQIPALSRPSRLPSKLRSAIALAGGLSTLSVAAIAAFFAIAQALNRPLVPYLDPGIGATPSPAMFDPSVAGPGIVTDFSGTLDSVPWVIAVLGWLVLAAITFFASERWRRAVLVGAIVAAIALGFGARAISTHPGFEFSGAWGPLLGLDVRAEAPKASTGPDVWYVTAERGEPFALVFSVYNPGPLPIRYLGVHEPNRPFVHAYHWSAVWQVDDSHGGAPAAEESRSFHPIDVAPREFLTLYLVGRASDCAYGPGFRLQNAASFGYIQGSPISVVYSVGGLTATSEIDLPVVIAEPVLGDCPPG